MNQLFTFTITTLLTLLLLFFLPSFSRADERQEGKNCTLVVPNAQGQVIDLAKPEYRLNTEDGYTVIASVLNSLKFGGTLLFPEGDYNIQVSRNHPPLQIPSNVTIQGQMDSCGNLLTHIHYSSNETSGALKTAWSNQGDHITIRNFVISRDSDIPFVLFSLHAGSDILIDRIVFDGKRSGTSRNQVHFLTMGIGSQSGQQLQDLTLQNSHVKNIDFVAFQPNQGLLEISTVHIKNNIFENYVEALEMNAPSVPNGIHDLVIQNNKFLNSMALGTGNNGFAIGFANAHNAEVSGNTIINHNEEPIHIENGSHTITIANNTIKDGGKKRFATAVQIIGGKARKTHDIIFTSNLVDDSRNPSQAPVINILKGGTATLPYNITITDNGFRLGRNQKYKNGIFIEKGSENIVVRGNQYAQ